MDGDDGAPLPERLIALAIGLTLAALLVVATVAADGWVWLTRSLTGP